MNCFKTIVYSSESKKIGVRMGRASVQHILGDDFLDEELRRVKSDFALSSTISCCTAGLEARTSESLYQKQKGSPLP